MRYSGQCVRRAAARTPFRGARRPGAAGESRDSRRAVTMALGCPRSSGGFAERRSRGPVVASARRFPSNAVALVLRAARGLSTAARSPGAARVRPLDLPRPGPPAARDRGAGGVAPRDPHRARGADLGAQGGDPRRGGRGAAQSILPRGPRPRPRKPRLPGSGDRGPGGRPVREPRGRPRRAPRLMRCASRPRRSRPEPSTSSACADSACRTRKFSRPSRWRRSPVFSARFRRASARRPTSISSLPSSPPRRPPALPLPRRPPPGLPARTCVRSRSPRTTSPRSRSSRAGSASSPRSFAPRR